MEPVYPQLTRVGGSHAQRLVFEDTLLEAYLREEQFDKATDMLRERLSRRESPRELYWMARAQAAREGPRKRRATCPASRSTGQRPTPTPRNTLAWQRWRQISGYLKLECPRGGSSDPP